MLLVAQCQKMLPNGCQCPNGIIDPATTTLSHWNSEFCLLHNQMDQGMNVTDTVDETNENTNSIPADKG